MQCGEHKLWRLGTFERVTFNNEVETKRVLHRLDAVGGHPSPNWATTIKFASSYIQDGPQSVSTQANPCIVISYATYLGCTEGQLVEAAVSLNGTLRYPNNLVNAIVVSHKWYVALVKYANGESTMDRGVAEEYKAPDSTVFLWCISTQVAHAHMDYLNIFA